MSRSTSSGAIESLEDDLKHALGQVGLSLDAELPRAKTTFRRAACPIAIIMTTTRGRSSASWYAREIEFLDYAF